MDYEHEDGNVSIKSWGDLGVNGDIFAPFLKIYCSSFQLTTDTGEQFEVMARMPVAISNPTCD
jgi:hypothetical protein